MGKPIYVTSPFLPPLDEFLPYLEKIWESKILTNAGPFHSELEAALCDYLGVKFISLFNNGTIALMVAIKALELEGEIITTPFSFVASSHAISWNKIQPVFVDIDPLTCNMDPEKIEEAITSRTTGIIPVHVYGNPCDAQRINEISKSNNLKVIYDAAHAMGVRKDDKSILNYGDLSVMSFHATKVFNTFEGGAIVCQTLEMKQKIDNLKNFGFQSEIAVKGIGINGKMNEIQAAMGLLQLNHIEKIISQRKKLTQQYREALGGIVGLRYLEEAQNVDYNYSYFPIFINEETFGKSRDEVYEYLKSQNIYSRRYFYPLISEFDEYINESIRSLVKFPAAYQMSRKVICLPLYPELKSSEISWIVRKLKECV
jgi:dTDP-4-amino-4,6-dideoxygalactose transaminase